MPNKRSKQIRKPKSMSANKTGRMRSKRPALLPQLAASLLESVTPLLRLLGDLAEGSDIEHCLNRILEEAQNIMGADRAEIARWIKSDEVVSNQRKYSAGREVRSGKVRDGFLLIEAQSGTPPPKACLLGSSVHENGMVVRAWNAAGNVPKVIFSNRLRAGSNYVQADDRTASEVAIRIQHRNRRFGVLNIEWFERIEWTEDRDVLLRLIADQLALALAIEDRERELRSVAGAASDEQEARAVCAMLERESELRGFQCALVYEADKENGKLHANYYLKDGKANFVKNDRRHWSYDIQGGGSKSQSFAGYVFHTGRPKWEPDAETSSVANQEGVREFGIRGAMLGLPLLFRNVPVGVVVMWGGVIPRGSSNGSEHFRAMSELLALRLNRVSMNKGALERFTQIIRGSQGYIGPDEAIIGILRAVQACGFDRARYLKYVAEDESFVRVIDVDAKANVNTDQVVIPICEADHARFIAQSFQQWPHAVIFDPLNGNLGPDKFHKQLGKSKDTPWISGMIVSQGQLVGQICADNEISKLDFPAFAKPLLSLASSIAALVLERASTSDVSESEYADVFPTAMFRKDSNSRFQWVNDIFVRDVAKCLYHQVEDADIQILCGRIVSAKETNEASFRRDINTLRKWIIGRNDCEVFGDSELSRSYIERDKRVMGWRANGIDPETGKEVGECKRERAKPDEWPHEPNSQGHRVRLVHVVKAPIYNAAGDPVGVQGFYIENSLARNFVTSNVGIFQSTPDGRFIYVNNQLAKLLGYKSNEDEAIYRLRLTPDVYYDSADREYFIEEVRAGNSISNFEFFIKRPGLNTVGDPERSENNRIKVAEYAWAVLGESGEIQFYEGFVRDIKNQIFYSATVSDQDEDEVAKLVARIIAHEAGNPLQIIESELTEFTRRMTSDKSNEKQRASVDRLCSAIQTVKTVLDDYAVFGKDESAEGTLRVMGGPARLNDVVNKLLFWVEDALESAGFERPILNLCCEDNTVVMPRVKVMQMIINLIKNSIESPNLHLVKGARTICIETSVTSLIEGGAPTHAVLRYEDTAGGMDEATRKRIFERDEDRLAEQADGKEVGVGMLIVEKMLNRYKCKREPVESVMGRGSVFRFKIPLHQQ